MDPISGTELKSKLDRGENFKLVMTMDAWAYRLKHIPGSINVTRPEVAASVLSSDDEIVVYCSSEDCVYSANACRALRDNGYRNVRHYAGGLQDWEELGYPVEGEDTASR